MFACGKIRISVLLAMICSLAPISRPISGARASALGQEPGPKDKNSREAARIRVQDMSPMGRLAQLSVIGQLRLADLAARRGNGAERAIENRLRPINDREDEDVSLPGGQAETSIAVDSTGQHIVVAHNDTRGFSRNPVSVSGFIYSDDGGMTFTDGGQLPVTTGTSLIGTTV